MAISWVSRTNGDRGGAWLAGDHAISPTVSPRYLSRPSIVPSHAFSAQASAMIR